jgi:hypothetical protein
VTDKIPVRTTMQPWKELLVDKAEYTDLAAQGLILPGTEQHEIAATVAASTGDQAAKPTAKTKKGD